MKIFFSVLLSELATNIKREKIILLCRTRGYYIFILFFFALQLHNNPNPFLSLVILEKLVFLRNLAICPSG